jgi:uncharacterized membrane protein YdjX (TVP38/TMEM64 family)
MASARTPGHPAHRRRWSVPIALGLAALVLLRLGAGEWVLALHSQLEAAFSRAGVGGALAFVVLAASSVLLSVFTSAPLVPAAVAAWGAAATMLLLVSGWMLGELGAYAIGRFGGRSLLGRFVRLDRIDHWVRVLPDRRLLALAILIRMTFPSEVAYLFGFIRFRFAWFLLLTVLAEAPTAALLVFASNALLARRYTAVAVVVALAVVLGAAAWLARTRFERRAAA